MSDVGWWLALIERVGEHADEQSEGVLEPVDHVPGHRRIGDRNPLDTRVRAVLRPRLVAPRLAWAVTEATFVTTENEAMSTDPP